MGRELVDAPWAEQTVHISEELTGLPLREAVVGTGEELARTQVAQPALLLVEWLAFLGLEQRGFSCQVAAGHSLGEYAALAAAGVFSWEQAMALVAVRGRVMEEAAQAQRGGMTAIVGLPVEMAKELASEAGCEVANYNAPEQTVLAGEPRDLRRAGEMAKERGGKAIPLSVAGAFHTSCMATAQQELALRLEEVQFSSPRCMFISGVSGKPEDDPSTIGELLKRQMTSPVRWSGVVDALARVGPEQAIEVGPGSVLTRLGRMQTGAVGFRALEEVTGHA